MTNQNRSEGRKPHFVGENYDNITVGRTMSQTRRWTLECGVGFMHGGTPAHFSIAARNPFMLGITGGRLDAADLSFGTTLSELNRLNFFFWSHLESLAYDTLWLLWRVSRYGSSSFQLTSSAHRICLNACATIQEDKTSNFSCDNYLSYISDAELRSILRIARRNRRQTAGEIARHTTQATGRPISHFTVARRLHGGGLFARRPVRCVPLTPAHRRKRSLWCREHWNWRDDEWGRVLFTDESRFSLSSDSHCILIWRERGSRNHPSNIIERDRYGGRGVLV
ncbi:HTH_Tnp_Tc3_2 domain-containing protein [Trichonephila clavipes]|nr:HTH_Tnp_Tc3_2 domain-containing protein [Trichonephila clavipes]